MSKSDAEKAQERKEEALGEEDMKKKLLTGKVNQEFHGTITVLLKL